MSHHWMRWAGVGAMLAMSGCAVVEREQRPGPPTIQRATGFVAEAPAPVAAAPLGAPAVWPETAPIIYAKSAILIDADTGRTVFQKNADMVRQVASTQKLLTALLVVERGNLDGTVVVAASDTAVEPTVAGIRAGQVYTRRQLLKALLVHSCNDVAATLARDHSGSVQAFSMAMTARAAALGATTSYFLNPHGLPAPQFSSARDMARIAYRAYREPEIRAITQLPGFTFVFSNGRTRFLKSTNKLLGVVPGVDGMKTGFTNAAGRCLITSASLGGRHFILVQLGSKTSYIFDDAARMMMWAAR